MNPIVLSCSQARNIDVLAVEKYGIPSIVLMENAGRGLTDLLCSQNPERVVICCGKGNNGGDGFVMARHLSLRHIPVEVYAVAEESQYKGDALTNLTILKMLGIPVYVITDTDWESFNSALEQSDWIVDALLGTGTKGTPRTPYSEIIDLINRADKKVLSVDIPSGFDGDTGESTIYCIRPTITGSMVANKTGLINATEQQVGIVKIVDIGFFPNDEL